MSHPRFLNKDVEKEVRSDPVLYVAWCICTGPYDWEIDPLHNPDYVLAQQQRETSLLETLKKKILILRDEREVFDS